MFSCLITLLCISTLRSGTVSKCAAFVLLREFKLMLLGSPACSRCKQAFEMVSCVHCEWGIGGTKIRGPGSALYETGWLWQRFIQQGTALPKCVGCAEDRMFSKCRVTVVPTTYYEPITFLCINSTYVSFMYCTYKLLLLLPVQYWQESFCTVPIIMTSSISTLVDLWNAE